MLFYGGIREYLDGERKRLQRMGSSLVPEMGVIKQVFGPAEEQDRKKNKEGYSVTRPLDFLEIDGQGITGDRHHCFYRDSTTRERELLGKGHPIRQHRHIFAVSPHDCEVLSERLDVEVTPELLGANLVIADQDGRQYSTHNLPPRTHFVIASEDSQSPPRDPIAVLVNYSEQQGCGITGLAIATHHGDKALTAKFVNSSKDHRGIVCSVEHPTEDKVKLKPGQKVFFRFPKSVAP